MKNYSYVTLLTNDSYVYGVTLLVESMRRVNTQYPLHVLIIDEVHAATIEILDQLRVTYSYVDVIPTPNEIYQHNLDYEPNTAATWRNCWTKFHIFNQTQFDKIVFLDADIMIMKNLDHLFEYPHMTAALDGEYFNLWRGWDHFNSGCLVIEPSQILYQNILTFANNLKEPKLPEYIIADQEVLNMYYKDWPQQKHLHLNKYYDIFPPYILDDQVQDVTQNCYFLHFVGRKPWTFWLRSEQEIYSEFFYSMAKEMVESRIQTLNWFTIQSQLILTVYAICKNEHDNIIKWLNSFGEADYICVLDTGSTDGSWELLQEEQKHRPNLIIDQKIVKPWRYDEARNISMTLIPKETTIYFMADLDEVIKEPGWSKLAKQAWDPLFNRGSYSYNRDVGPNDIIIRQIPEYRFHSSDWYKWENIVHEALVNHAGHKHFFIETCTPIPITVWHYPKDKKENDYALLCEDTLEENPNDYIMKLQLAIEYEIRNEYEKAINMFRSLIDDPGDLQTFEQARCYYSLGQLLYHETGDLNTSLALFREGRLVAPDVLDNYIASAQFYYDNKQYQQAFTITQEGLKNADTARWCTLCDPQSYVPYWILGMSSYFLKNYFDAFGYMKIAEIKSPTSEVQSLCTDITREIINNPKKIIKERN